MRLVIPLIYAAPFLVSGACAEEGRSTPSVAQDSRYTMTPVPNGFLRLDTRTGAVSLCTVTGTGAECRAVDDDRAALSAQVDELKAKNAELEAKLAEGGGKPVPPGSTLPSDQDMDRALNFAERFMRRMMRLMRDEGGDRT